MASWTGMEPDLASRWPLARGYDARDALLRAYAAPGRHYHDVTHLTEVLDRVELLSGEAQYVDVVRLAAWFHDAVHEGGADDEERSAQLAEVSLRDAGLDPRQVAEVARLVRLTATHDPETADRDGAVLTDADLGILAAEPQRYAAYTAGVREEYARLDDAEFAHGRAEVLRRLMAAPTLFRTVTGRRLWEDKARANVTAELARLEAGD